MKRRWVHSRCPESLVVVGVSQWFTERLREQEVGRFRIEHIPNGIDTEVFRPIPDAREQLGIATREKIVLFLSSPAGGWKVNERKGVIPLAEAFLEEVVPGDPDAILVVAGDRLVPNHPRVRGIGYVAMEDLPLWYSAASVFVLPSKGDNLPYTVLEAMACGCPVVATSVGGIPEMVEDRVTGLLVDDCGQKELGGALRAILRDEERGRAMGRRAREKVVREYGMPGFLERHGALYRSLKVRGLDSGTSPAPRAGKVETT